MPVPQVWQILFLYLITNGLDYFLAAVFSSVAQQNSLFVIAKVSLKLICPSSSIDDIKAYFLSLSSSLETPQINIKLPTYKTNTDVNVFFFLNGQSQERDILNTVVLMKYFLFLLLCKMAKGLALQVFLSLAHCTFQVSLKKSRHRPVYFPSPPPLLPPPPSFFPPSPSLLPPSARCSSEGHELKLPFGLPLRHPHGVGGVLRHLHDADRERLISLVDMVSHYLAGGRENTRGASTQPVLLRGHKVCGFQSSWGNRVKAVGGNRKRGGIDGEGVRRS